MIVAIDGPAASGKSTTARAVARRLGFRHLDSGAFYRALVVAAIEAGLPRDRWDSLDEVALDALRVSGRPGQEGFRLFVGDHDVTDRLRGDDVNRHVSAMASIPAVRSWLLHPLRAAAEGVDLVADGRDIGTVVFPEAEVKVFLIADPLERARRRLRERGVEEPEEPGVRAEADQLLARDRQDSERAVAPLVRAPDAVEVDTTRLSFEEQVQRIVDLVVQRQGGG